MSEIYQPKQDSFLLSKVIKTQIPRLLKQNKNLIFLEIGCGSGIQLKTALNFGIKKHNIFSCDINSEAVEYCKKLGFDSVKSNLFENIKEKYHLIIFNPPYLPENKKEPKDSRIATTGGKKGSEITNKFLKQAKNHLKKDGKIFLLTSSLTKQINFSGYKKKIIEKEKLFFEELRVLELTLIV